MNGTWAEDNKDWVNSLVRDTSNPSTNDVYFPVSRMFDWYSGHSWATGVFNTYKNIESSSESLHHAAALKLWGKVIGDQSLEARGGLMLAIMTRSYNDYFYFKSDNTVQPLEILPNKVSGIFFENKIDYTTFLVHQTNILNMFMVSICFQSLHQLLWPEFHLMFKKNGMNKLNHLLTM